MPTQELTDQQRYDYGQELSALRVKKGVSVDELAAAITRSTSSIYMAQTGKAYCEPIQEAMREYLDGLPDGDGEPDAEGSLADDETKKLGPVGKAPRRVKRKYTRRATQSAAPLAPPPRPTLEHDQFHALVYPRTRAQIEEEAETADEREEENDFDSETLRLACAYRNAQRESQAALDALISHLDT